MATENLLKKIEKTFLKVDSGLTIQQVMGKTDLARGTVKDYLDELIRMGRIHEEVYAQNTKVYFLNGKGQYQQEINAGTNRILYVDVMTDPWKNPFVRIKLRRGKEDIGAIFIDSERAIDNLIDALETARPQLKRYRDAIENLEKPVPDHN